jgi:hypothetical protein
MIRIVVIVDSAAIVQQRERFNDLDTGAGGFG